MTKNRHNRARHSPVQCSLPSWDHRHTEPRPFIGTFGGQSACWRTSAPIHTGLAERSRAHLAALAGRLGSLSPLAVLDRGYALVRRGADAGIVRSSDDVGAGDRVVIRVAAAEIDALVEFVRVPDR